MDDSASYNENSARYRDDTANSRDDSADYRDDSLYEYLVEINICILIARRMTLIPKSLRGVNQEVCT
jgi:hypothetical protein